VAVLVHRSSRSAASSGANPRSGVPVNFYVPSWFGMVFVGTFVGTSGNQEATGSELGPMGRRTCYIHIGGLPLPNPGARL